MLQLRQLDRTAVLFEAAVARLGNGDARASFARALNHETKKAHTAVKRELRLATSVKLADISRAVKMHRAGSKTLKTVLKATGAAIPLRYFGPRQFKYGVRATVWGRSQQFKSAFIVKSLAGGVFENTGGYNEKSGRFNAVRKMYGPSIPKEMITDPVVKTFQGYGDRVAERAMHEMTNILRGRNGA